VTLERYVAAIDEEVRAQLRGASPALEPFYEMMRYHLGMSEGAPRAGKRLRPLLCLLLAEGLGAAAAASVPAAAALELLHNFTLIHDDIEDQDRTRHHYATVWAVWGVPHAINAGDGMYALSRVALQRLRESGGDAARILEAAAVLDRACVLVCEGQFLDLTFEGRLDVTETNYREMAARKTGALFRASAEIAGILAGVGTATRDALAVFGGHFGAAFQAHDDLKGVWGAASETGKEEMNDIAKRKMTLPIVRALARASAAQVSALAETYGKAAPLPAEDVRRVRALLDALGVRAEVEGFIAEQRDAALAALASVALAEGPRGLLRRLVDDATGARG
jgi:geranylgeranyl diphosphate synthase type I